MADQKASRSAKKVTAKVVKAEKAAELPPEIAIDLATSEEDVVAYDMAGALLVFSKKRFRKLSRENVELLGHENQRRYYETVEILRREQEAKRPIALPQVLDPLGSHEGAILSYTITDPTWEKRWHLCWKYAQEKVSLADQGYAPVDSEKDPVKCRAKTAGNQFVIIDRQARADLDILLMKLPMHLFIEHQNAVSIISQDKIKGIKDRFAGTVEEGSKGRLKALDTEEEGETVELSRSQLHRQVR